VVIALLTVSAFMVFWGTTYPLPSSLIGRPGTYDPSWYNRWNVPLYVVLLGLLSFGPFLSWMGRPAREWRRHLALPAIAGASGCGAAALLGFGGAGELALFFVALAAMTANVVRLVLVAREKPLHTGAAVAHVGFALMFAGMVASGAWGRKHEVSLPIGQPVQSEGVILTYRGHVDGSEPKHRWRVAVMPDGKAEEVLEVRMYSKGRGDDGRDQIMRFPAIRREVARDLYVAPLALVPAGDAGNLELRKSRPVPYRGATLTFLRFETAGSGDQHVMTVRALVEIARGAQRETVSLPVSFADGRFAGEPVSPRSLPGVSLKLERMSVEDGLVLVRADDGSAAASETLIVEASVKPLIGLLWTGTLLVGLGCTLAAIRRWLELRAMPAGPVPLPVPAAAGAGLPTAAGRSAVLSLGDAKRAERPSR
jgi:cytochrome c-type biogenesis protein CcmF